MRSQLSEGRKWKIETDVFSSLMSKLLPVRNVERLVTVVDALGESQPPGDLGRHEPERLIVNGLARKRGDTFKGGIVGGSVEDGLDVVGLEPVVQSFQLSRIVSSLGKRD